MGVGKSGSERTYQVVIHVFVAVFALSALFPLIYVLGMSLTGQPELMARHYFVIIPTEPTFIAYSRILSTDVVWRSMLISVFRSAVGPALMLVLTLFGAYVLSYKTLPGRRVFLLFILATILFQGGLIPSYLVVRRLGLTNTLAAYVIPMAIDSFGLLVIKVFIENLPAGLMESAQIDGAGHLRLLFNIVAPLTMPALAAIGMFNIVAHWNSWFDALIYVGNKNLWPLQMILRNMLLGSALLANDQMNSALMLSQRVGIESLKMATIVIGIIPMLILYPFLQRYFIHGVYLGAIKG
jgi:putative aldouronate transport system permease protein